MRAINHCDFCASDAAGTYEVIPAELDPTEAEQRRVSVCPDCKRRLGTVLEPLLDRLRSDTTTGSRQSHSDTETAETPATDGTGSDDSSTQRTPPESTSSEGEVNSDPDSGSVAKSDAPPAGRFETGNEITFDEPSDETPSSEDATGGTDEAAAEPARESNPIETEAEPTARSESTRAAPASPRAYPKVIRLLRNREFPMGREAVESLAAGAYDLEAEEAEAIIEHALERDEFAERGGELHRPSS
ncbi:hypothetical protein [Natrialba asiatica]|uniref:Uncharacterized protein n=1 Tax=Natrialba asiatica (strain ATCC 700177 / DSM 12278 / JCM 9576 / FERM P-10747 / NBRC 102637 / 172P1) TaxID=29540 RepID=M0AL92_NATA1|nr:hypothetical protein [Natrialba asiatica]ELY98143.1 hypothetical protein C481_19455 [Natrialba asiatica DSM 12278]